MENLFLKYHLKYILNNKYSNNISIIILETIII